MCMPAWVCMGAYRGVHEGMHVGVCGGVFIYVYIYIYISFISYIDSTELHTINIKIQYNNITKHYQLVHNISIIRNMSLRSKNWQPLSCASHHSLTEVPT